MQNGRRERVSMKRRITLFISASILLTACQESFNPARNEASRLTVLPVEYYSGSTVLGVEVTLLDEAGQVVESQYSFDGEVVFDKVKQDTLYTIQVGQGELITTQELLFDGSQSTAVIETRAVTHEQALAVPIVKQLPQLPHGCEITSLTAVLNYYGEPVSKTTMVEYMPREAFTVVNGQKVGPDPHLAYAGNPASPQGTYVFSEPIVIAANDYLADSTLKMQAHNVSGSTLEQLKQYVAQGIPVVSWVTLDLSPPKTKDGWLIKSTNNYHKMFTNLHAVVIVDIRDGVVEVMDPLKGYMQYNEQQFFASYQSLGEQAVVVY